MWLKWKYFSRDMRERERKGQTSISENDEENFLITSVIGFSRTTSLFSHWTLTLWFIRAVEAAIQVSAAYFSLHTSAHKNFSVCWLILLFLFPLMAPNLNFSRDLYVHNAWDNFSITQMFNSHSNFKLITNSTESDFPISSASLFVRDSLF